MTVEEKAKDYAWNYPIPYSLDWKVKAETFLKE